MRPLKGIFDGSGNPTAVGELADADPLDWGGGPDIPSSASVLRVPTRTGLLVRQFSRADLPDPAGVATPLLRFTVPDGTSLIIEVRVAIRDAAGAAAAAGAVSVTRLLGVIAKRGTTPGGEVAASLVTEAQAAAFGAGVAPTWALTQASNTADAAEYDLEVTADNDGAGALAVEGWIRVWAVEWSGDAIAIAGQTGITVEA